jgi:hypothetical protein
MAWGGSGAALVGLSSEVDLAEWRAVFATGGPYHPDSHERVVQSWVPRAAQGKMTFWLLLLHTVPFGGSVSVAKNWSVQVCTHVLLK